MNTLGSNTLGSNTFGKREWEIYNFDQIGASSEYDNILINKDIDNYFNDLISKPIPPNQTNILVTKSNYSFEKFYLDHIEHNLLFIVLLVGIIIFLIIRHYIKDFDTFGTELTDEKNKEKNVVEEDNNTNTDESDNSNNSNNSNNTVNKNTANKNYSKKKILNKLKINKLNQIKKQQQFEKIKLINYKKQLDEEKEKILTIIDELSNMNDYESSRLKPYPNYLGQDINVYYGTNYSNTQKFFNQAPDNLPKLPHNLNDNSQYCDINKNLDDETNKINGLYIEPPFN
jgi:hypothetical protein